MQWRVVEKRFYLAGIRRRRVEYPELFATVKDIAETVQPDTIVIEDKGSGIGLFQDLREDPAGYPAVAFDQSKMDEESRMRVQSAKIEG